MNDPLNQLLRLADTADAAAPRRTTDELVTDVLRADATSKQRRRQLRAAAVAGCVLLSITAASWYAISRRPPSQQASTHPSTDHSTNPPTHQSSHQSAHPSATTDEASPDLLATNELQARVDALEAQVQALQAEIASLTRNRATPALLTSTVSSTLPSTEALSPELQFRLEVERAAGRLLLRANRLRNAENPSAAEAAYRQVLRDFPDTFSAEASRQQLEEPQPQLPRSTPSPGEI